MSKNLLKQKYFWGMVSYPQLNFDRPSSPNRAGIRVRSSSGNVPASTSKTDHFLTSDNLFATIHPVDPAPSTMKSKTPNSKTI